MLPSRKIISSLYFTFLLFIFTLTISQLKTYIYTYFSKIGEGRITKKEAVVDNICNVCSCPINIIDPKRYAILRNVCKNFYGP